MATLNLSIKADQILDVLPVTHASRRVPLFIGKPGIAKTAFVHEAAADIGRRIGAEVRVRELHLASMSEVDVRGYLIPNGENAVFTKPEFWADVERYPHGILFLDEFMQATHEVQKAVAPLILEGRIGEYKLPPGWSVALAGNDIDDNAGANTLLSHIVNRVTMVKVTAPDPDVWASWAAMQQLPFEVIAFAKYRPNLVFDADIPDAANVAYCTPRSLHAVADLALAYPGGIRAMVESRVGTAMIHGAIGDGPAGELIAMVRTAVNLPSYEEVVANPLGTRMPEAPDQLYAMMMLLAVRAKFEDADKVMTYIARTNPNMAITGIVSLVRRDRMFATSKAMGEWVRSNRALLEKFGKYITEAL